MAEHVVNAVTIKEPVTVIHKLDPAQFATLIEVLKSLALPEPDQDVEALTAKLKKSGDALASAVDAASKP